MAKECAVLTNYELTQIFQAGIEANLAVLGRTVPYMRAL